jgi:hypothetical protein
MVRNVHEVARFTKIPIKYKILISRKLCYLATLWSQRCCIA